MGTIAVVCPLPQESALFFELPGAPAEECFSIPRVERTYHGTRLAVATSGMGMTNMAGCVQFMIDTYAPDAVILSGIAGSLNPELGIGDIVVGEMLACLECSCAVIAECAPYTEDFRSDETLVAAAERALRKDGFAKRPAVSALSAEALEGLPFGTDEAHEPRYCAGTILSSNLFTTEAALLLKHRKVPLGDCEEMEGAAAAQLSARAGVPFLAVRCISNVCGEAYSELNDAEVRMDATARRAAKAVLATTDVYASESLSASSNPA